MKRLLMEKTIQEALSKGVEMHVSGEFDFASQLYGSVIKLDPNHADANHNMGLLKVDTGHALEALPYLQTALQADTSVAQFWLSYIKALLTLDKVDEASRVLSLAKESGAEGEEFLELHQQLNEPTVEVEPVKAEADTSSQSKPNILDTLKLDKALRLAKNNVKEGSHEEAKLIYQDILKKFPKNKKAIQGYQKLQAGVTSKGASSLRLPDEQFQELDNLFNQWKFEELLAKIKPLIDLFSKDIEPMKIPKPESYEHKLKQILKLICTAAIGVIGNSESGFIFNNGRNLSSLNNTEDIIKLPGVDGFLIGSTSCKPVFRNIFDMVNA